MVALCSEESFFILRYNAEYDGEPDEVTFLLYNCKLNFSQRMVTKTPLKLSVRQMKLSKLVSGLAIASFSQIH